MCRDHDLATRRVSDPPLNGSAVVVLEEILNRDPIPAAIRTSGRVVYTAVFGVNDPRYESVAESWDRLSARYK